MKQAANSFVTKATFILAAVLIIATTTNAQISRTQKPELKQKFVDNLIIGIHSENEGLKKSTIYFAGKYQIDQAVDALIEELKVDENPSVRISIVLALYKIGNEKGLEAICTNASLENDPHVKRICAAIVEEYSANKYIFTSAANSVQE